MLRCDLLPEVWLADETRERRQQVRLRISLGQHRAALKNQVHDQVGQHIARQDARLKAMAREDARGKWLATIPGIGVYSAMILLAEIGQVRRFSDAKALCSYAGLVPWVRESAGHKSHGGISRCGSPRLRWVMVEAAHTALRCSPAARQYFDRLRQRKHAHVARVALARKLLTAAFALLRDGACFDETIFAAV